MGANYSCPTRHDLTLRCEFQTSVNSARVSFKLRAQDALEALLQKQSLRFLMLRADDMQIIRRVPLPGYDVTFLVTDRHLRRFFADKLIGFIVKVMQDLLNISTLKLAAQARGRALASNILRVMSP